MIAYKLVYGCQNNQLRSYGLGDKSTLCVTYKKNRWVSAHPTAFELGFGLAVFKRLKDLKAFHTPDSRSRYQIWRCETYTPKNWKPSRHLNSLGVYSIQNLKDNRWPYPWPDGTRLVQKVKLLKRIK